MVIIMSPHAAATMETGTAVSAPLQPEFESRQTQKVAKTDAITSKWKPLPLSEPLYIPHPQKMYKIYIANRNKKQNKIYVEELLPPSQSYRLLVKLLPGKHCLSLASKRSQTVDIDFF